MKKTSVYLDDKHIDLLRSVARLEGRSQSQILRDAVLMYANTSTRPRTFVMSGVVNVPGLSAAELTEEEMLEGFGE